MQFIHREEANDRMNTEERDPSIPFYPRHHHQPVTADSSPMQTAMPVRSQPKENVQKYPPSLLYPSRFSTQAE